MSSNPRTATFLFTDLENSTPLWEDHPVLMQELAAKHDALIRDAIETHRGRVVKTTGDGFHAVFDAATDGIAAALAGQHAILAEKWSNETGPLKVRMGLHTGKSHAREGDYYGPEVNRAARVMGSGHGGQILLSGATAALVRNALTSDVTLVDLGQHRLKGLAALERIFQLRHPELPFDFPPLTTLNRQVTNLPAQRNAFVGREREIEEVSNLLQRKDVRLLTLTGAGGSGKTRLGLQVAEELIDEYEHGVFFVPLAPIRDPAFFVSTVARTWALRETGEHSLLDALKEYLQGKHLLLVLDNFEQVLDAGLVVADLLAHAAGLKVLVTSREALQIYGERIFLVPTLSLPGASTMPSIERLLQYEAVSLFVERALAVNPKFALTDDNAAAVAQICRRLDGLPLAIELAAARIHLLPPQAMLARMKHRLPLLKGGATDLPRRQQTLNNAISWSYDLLDDGEQRLFRRMAIFAGATLEAVEAVCNADGDLSSAMLDDLESLVNKSLLIQAEMDGEPRFVMLETIREYALGKLEESGELETIRAAHLDFFLKLSKQADAELMGPTQAAWLTRMEQERDNLRAVLDWSLNEPEQIVAGTNVVAALMYLITTWQLRGELEEWSYWIDLALEMSTNAPIHVRAKLLEGKAFQAFHRGAYEQARHNYDQSSALYLEAGDSADLGRMMIYQVHVALGLGDSEQALQLAKKSVEMNREAGAQFVGYEAASLVALGDALYLQGNPVKAQESYENSLALIEDLGSPLMIGRRKTRLGQAALALEDYDGASSQLVQGLALANQVNDHWGLAMALGAFGCLFAAQGQPDRASTLLAAARAHLEAYSTRFWPLDQHEYDLAAARVRQMLDQDSFTETSNDGISMTIEEAIEYVAELIEADVG